MIFVVDTNVAIVANEKSGQASPECVIACVDYLNEIMLNESLALDDKWRILKEYTTYLKSEGQPGVGDRFLRWILLNQATGKIDFVPITSLENDSTNFKEFPSDPHLEKFDPADRKFVAVTLAHPEHPPVLNAVDPGWWLFRSALEDNGVNIQFLCEADVMKLSQKSQ